MMHWKIALVFVAALALVSPTGAAAQATPAAVKAFPDYLSVRSEFLSSLITAAPAKALAFAPVYRDSPAGRLRVSVEKSGDVFFVLFQLERDGGYPAASRGNVIIKREAKTGYVTRVVWYLSDDGRSFISLTPKNERTLVDYVVAGSLVRGGYSVPRLVYQFFTGSFASLVDATRSSLDWSPVLGEPTDGGAALFAAELLARRPAAPVEEFIQTAADFSRVGSYLELAGHAVSVPVEISEQPYAQAAVLSRPFDPTFRPQPGWSEARGLSLASLPAILVSSASRGSAFIAMMEGLKGEAPLLLAVAPYRGADGSYAIAALDAKTRAPVDLLALADGAREQAVRLFSLPLPDSLQ